MASSFQTIRIVLSHPTLRRWLDLAFLAVVSVLFFKIGTPEVQTLSGVFTNRSRAWSPLVDVLFCFVVAWITASIFVRLGALRLGHFSPRRFLGFPPLWISALPASIVIIATQEKTFYEAFDPHFFAVAAWFIWWSIPIWGGLLLALVSSSGILRNIRSSNSMEPMSQRQADLQSWVEREGPIRLPSEDRFGFSILAQRIADILRAKPTKTVGVVGAYGTGKTSLLNLAEYYLYEGSTNTCSPQIVICRVDGWGRTRGSIAESILTMAVEQVAVAVDCSSVISLPANYRKALSGIGLLGGGILEALLDSSHDPTAQIRKLDEILAAAGVRLIILLEDLDRNTEDQIIRDEIPGLLDRLRGMKSISFALAIGTEHQYSNILIRICDYVESLA